MANTTVSLPKKPMSTKSSKPTVKATVAEITVEYVLALPQFKAKLDEIASEIRVISTDGANEATLAANIEAMLYEIIHQDLHYKIKLEKEVAIETVRHVKLGRMDSRVGAVVIEYKQKKKLTTKIDQETASNQLKNYLVSLPEENRHGAVGLLTDGWIIKFFAFEESGTLSETAFDSLSGKHLLRLIRTIVSSDRRALTPTNLISSFCGGDESPVQILESALYDAIKNRPTGRSSMLFKEWQTIFRLAHDDQSKQTAIKDRRDALAATLNIDILAGDNQTEYKALYAIQTAYAIIVKAIAFKTLGGIRLQNEQESFGQFAISKGDALRTHLERLESGDIFRQEGFGNLLEGDFFAWYCSKEQWTKSIEVAVKGIFSTLAEYENHQMFDGGRVQDFFKDLYMAIIPDKVRHSMGEFYTPAWLADQTVEEALSTRTSKKTWNALDPCCGSGTFITVLIQKVLTDVSKNTAQEQLISVLERVKGIDLNPLAALTARINYFINVSHLIGPDDSFDVPIYLGDASYVPIPKKIGEVDCLTYQIGTEKGPLLIALPASAVSDIRRFSLTMTAIEAHIEGEDELGIVETLSEIIAKSDLTPEIVQNINGLAKQLVDLQKNKWNGIWARIISNFLTTANLGRFDIIVGNPPWIDWKNLPQGYRERIKGICVARHLFSGDSITGGINLNICALIANVAAQNWLKNDGILGFLMPENLIFQKSYEGFRNFQLDGGDRLYFQKFVDWTRSGHPFAPVQHRFLGFFLSRKEANYREGIPVIQYVKLASSTIDNIKPLKFYGSVPRFSSMTHAFRQESLLAITAHRLGSGFTYARGMNEVMAFRSIAGDCVYAGREGVEIFPQELFLLKVVTGKALKAGKAYVNNYQSTKSKHKIAYGTFLIETDLLFPLVKGVDIERFHIKESGYVVPFPYDKMSRSPIPRVELTKRAPNLMKYFNQNKAHFEAQTAYNSKIIGEKHASEFYALARVGDYTYGSHFVAFRDNTKWQAAVVSTLPTPWGENKRPVFQNHAVSISQREDGSFISLDEAHFICGLFNAPVVAKFLLQSSDSRSFKIRPPIMVPKFDSTNAEHVAVVELSREAHINYKNKARIAEIDKELDAAFVKIASLAKKQILIKPEKMDRLEKLF